jgi:hypothetical protein
MSPFRHTIKTLLTVLASFGGLAVAAKLVVWFLNGMGYLQTLEQVARWIPWNSINESSWWIAPAIVVACLVLFLIAGRWPEKKDRKLSQTEAPKASAELRLEADPNIKGCHTLNITGGGRITKYLHAAVSVNIDHVTNCKAYLTMIVEDDRIEWIGQEQLTFSPSEASDSLGKTIHHGITSFLDVLAITNDGTIYLCNEKREWLRWPRLHDIFSKHANYVLTIAIAGDGIATQSKNFVFNWTGNWQTCFLTSQPLWNEAHPLEPIQIRDEVDLLIERGRWLIAEWQTPRADYSKQREREEASLDWLLESTEAVKKHLKIEQFDRFMSKHTWQGAMQPGTRFKFSMNLQDAGIKADTGEYELAFEVASKVELLREFRDEITRGFKAKSQEQ